MTPRWFDLLTAAVVAMVALSVVALTLLLGAP